MEVHISGKQVDLGAALRDHVEQKLREVDQKYASRTVDARVVVSKTAHVFRCDCLAHLSSGLHAQAEAEADDPYAACDRAITRLEKQLRRYKRRLKDHHQRRKEPVAKVAGSSYVLADADDDVASPDGAAVAETAGDRGFWTPEIVEEAAASIPALSVGEAVMQMELAGASFLLFVSDETGRVNVVHRRDDGKIGWVDPQPGA